MRSRTVGLPREITQNSCGMPAEQLRNQLHGRCGGRVHDRPHQMTVGAVEGELDACDRDKSSLAGRTGRRAIQDDLARLGHIARREVAHDYNSTPMQGLWPAHYDLDVLCRPTALWSATDAGSPASHDTGSSWRTDRLRATAHFAAERDSMPESRPNAWAAQLSGTASKTTSATTRAKPAVHPKIR